MIPLTNMVCAPGWEYTPLSNGSWHYGPIGGRRPYAILKMEAPDWVIEADGPEWASLRVSEFLRMVHEKPTLSWDAA